MKNDYFDTLSLQDILDALIFHIDAITALLVERGIFTGEEFDETFRQLLAETEQSGEPQEPIGGSI